MIVILAGLPGSGKSTLAHELARKLPAVAILDKDIIRAALFAPEHIEYSTTQDDFCQEIMLETAAYLLKGDHKRCVLLDGRTFSRRYQRQRAFDFSHQINTPCAIIECVCSEPTALARIQQALERKTHLAANRTPDLYAEIRRRWEPIEDPKLTIDTDSNLDENTNQAAQFILSLL